MLDKFSNLADSLPNSERKDLWRFARMVAAEGRKAGIHLTVALQDPTHKSIDLRIRRNTTPLTFRVKDESASRVILGATGAQNLPPRHFLTVMNDLKKGIAFAPSDNDIVSLLQSSQVSQLPVPTWLSPNTIQTQQPDDKQAQKIRELHEQGLSLNQIQREIFGYVGGAAYATVKNITETFKIEI